MAINKYIVICIFLICIKTALAGSLGASPAHLNFNNIYRSGYAESYILISTTSDNRQEIDITSFGEVAGWLAIEESLLIVSKERPISVKVTLSVPDEVPVGTYHGELHLIAKEEHLLFGQKTRSAIIIPILVTVTGDEQVSCRVLGLELEEVDETFPLEFALRIMNKGNVVISPQISILVMQDDMMLIDETLASEPIRPTQVKKSSFTLDHSLPADTYQLKVDIPQCNYSRTEKLEIEKAGSIKDNLELTSIESVPYVYAGERIPITAQFKNNGRKAVHAYFKGEITTGTDMTSFRTKEVTVLPFSTMNLTTHFIPEKSGTYTVKGRIHYSERETFEKSYSIEVFKKKNDTVRYGMFIIYLLIGITILVLIVKILIMKKGYK